MSPPDPALSSPSPTPAKSGTGRAGLAAIILGLKAANLVRVTEAKLDRYVGVKRIKEESIGV